MINIIRSFLHTRFILTVGLVLGSALISYFSSKIAFERFQALGLVSLGNALNYVGTVYILSSLSIESGLIRRMVILQRSNFKSFDGAIILLYPLGIILGFSYIFLMPLNGIISSIYLIAFLIFLYFPYCVLRSYFIAIGKSEWNSLLVLVIASSSLFAVLSASTPDEIFKLIVFFQIILIGIILTLCCFMVDSFMLKLRIFHNIPDRKKIKLNIFRSINLLRYSVHSMSSGFQSNQFLLVSRIFLLNSVSTEFAGQMEMYQRPLIWLFTLGVTLVSLFFYPNIVKKEVEFRSNTSNSSIMREIWKDIAIYGFCFFIFIVVAFPFLFWMTFGFDVEIELLMASFWIFIFSLRMFAALFSSCFLAKNNIRGAVIGEAILYIPPIIVFSLPLTIFDDMQISMVTIYLIIIGISSLVQIGYFLFVLRIKPI